MAKLKVQIDFKVKISKILVYLSLACLPGTGSLTFELRHLEISKDLSSQSFFEFLLHHRDNGKEITDDAIGGNFKDGGIRILIDGNNDI
jgi:hypothetical protein